MRLLTNRLLLKLSAIAVAATPTAAFAAEASEDKGSGPLNLVYGEAIWNLIVFLLVLALLAKFVFPAIRDGLKAREQKLEGDLSAAEQARAQAEASLAEYKAKITEAQKEAQKVVDEARKSAEQVAAKVKADAEMEIGKMRERSQAEITAAKDQAISEMHAHMAELSTQIAGRILKREINADDQQQLVNESLSELTQSGV